MFTRLYIEALIRDPEAADEIWDLWNGGRITGEVAALAWLDIVACRLWVTPEQRR